MINYEVIEYKEILHELFAGMLADIDRLLKKYNIPESSTEPLVIFQKKINIIWLDILSRKYSTMEDMMQLKGIYLFAKEYIEELNSSPIEVIFDEENRNK
ncbi:hypothetical protein [Anaerovibrio sp. RM50]|uniref:hypothetical protein n=1 Tax=Anaerovibrio sp. RM50 TaxID=1200557 RepID=UPI0006880530|nr:hypothetical protein [Anaerovibrio sp. RM50]